MGRSYVPSLSPPDAPVMLALLQRADRCCRRLEPKLPELLAADADIARRFPWHSGSDVDAPPSFCLNQLLDLIG